MSRVGDFVVDRVARKDSEMNRKVETSYCKTAAKISLYWLANTAIVIPLISYASPLAGCLIGGVSLIPLIRPLYSNVKSLMSIGDNHFSSCETVQCVAAGCLFSIAECVVMFTISPMPIRRYASIGLAVSNLVVSGSLYYSNFVFNGRHEIGGSAWMFEDRGSFQKAMIKDIKLSEFRLIDLQRKRSFLEKFVLEREDLKQLCLKEYERLKRRVLIIEEPDFDPVDLNDANHVLTWYKFQINYNEDVLEEYAHFINSSTVLLEAFSKHVRELRVQGVLSCL